MKSAPENKQSQIEGLATLLVLDEEIRKLSNIREFGFFSVNETHRLIPYHSAYLWQLKELIGTHLVAQSGTAEIDIHTATNQWLVHEINKLRHGALAKEVHQLDAEEVKASLDETQLSEKWPEALPQYLLWCPLLSKSNQITGGLIFFREQPFTESEVKMLRWLIASYQYTWLTLVRPNKIPSWVKFKEKPYLIGISIAITTLLLFPVRLSVVGDATVTPKSPILINAPLQGVIQTFSVNPGDLVKKGQLLVTLDKTDLLSTVDISKKDYLLTQAKLRTAINESFDNKKQSRSEIPILQAQLSIDKARLDYANEQLRKAEIRSPDNGIVVFESKEDWIGQPVHTGERILMIANPNQVQLKISLPVTNAIKISLANEGEFFLYGQLSSLSFKITRLSYNAKLLPNKVLAYEYAADFVDPKDKPQLGAQGTVKIYGRYVPFVYYVLRRPLQAIRQTLGI